MLIYIHRPEGNLGPYSREELAALVANGTVGANEFAWYEGLSEWVPAQKILPPVPKATASPAPSFPSPFATTAAAERAEQTRRKYLSHEASVRSVSLLYYFGGSCLLVLGICNLGVLLTQLIEPSSTTPPDQGLGPLFSISFISALFLIFGVIYIWLGRQYSTLNPRAVIPGTIMAIIGLLGIPVGTLINAYILYLLYSEKGKVVFSERYRQVIEATPEIKYKTSIIVKIALGLLLAVIGLVVIAAILHALMHA